MSGFRIANTNFDPTPKIKPVKSKDWAERIWEKRNSTVERICEGCGRTMHLPVSKAGRRFCTLACRVKAAEKHLAKNCECCGKPSNLQFLCAPCNLTKSNKDPIDFMQSLGRLL